MNPASIILEGVLPKPLSIHCAVGEAADPPALSQEFEPLTGGTAASRSVHGFGQHILDLSHVTKSFRDSQGRVEVLRGVDLSISQGDFLIVTGPSGSGKSTLLNLAALLDKPDFGSIRFHDREISGLSDTEICSLRAHEIGMVFQKFHLLAHRSALENVLFRWRYVKGARGDNRSAARSALAQVGLDAVEHRPARLLSAGEMQRVAIARAVALQPKLLLADEPTGNLDKAAATTVMDCFRKLNDQGMTIMMVTHNDTLLHYGKRHLVCRDGILAAATG